MGTTVRRPHRDRAGDSADIQLEKSKARGAPGLDSLRDDARGYGRRVVGRRAGRRARVVSVRAFVVSPIRCVVSVVIFIESDIRVVVSVVMRVVSEVVFCCAFVHAPAAMTTSATTNAMRFMRAPVEGPGGRRNVHRRPAQSSIAKL